MKKLTYLAFLLILTISYSCKEDDPYKDYEGSWSGVYSGEDTGNWSATINDEGIVSGTAVSDSLPAFTFGLKGTISEDGAFNANSNSTLGTIDFTGQANSSSVSGEWVNTLSTLKGTWTGSKK